MQAMRKNGVKYFSGESLRHNPSLYSRLSIHKLVHVLRLRVLAYERGISHAPHGTAWLQRLLEARQMLAVVIHGCRFVVKVVWRIVLTKVDEVVGSLRFG